MDAKQVDTAQAVDAGGARIGSIDLATEADRGLIRRLATRNPRRWRMKDEFRDKCEVALDWALARAQELDEVDSTISCIKTAAMLEAQNQADEHHAEKMRLVAAEEGTRRIVQVVIQ